MKYHPIVELFPALAPEERAKLKESIRQHEVFVPVVVWEDQVIDGRHRADICDELGIEKPVETFIGTEREAIKPSGS